MATGSRGPGVLIPPPFLFIAGWAAAWLLHRALEFHIDGAGASRTQEGIGAGLVALGAAIVLWGITTFIRARTTVVPHRPARALVVEGPFRFTRNPMYIGLSLVYVGLALVTNLAWPIVLLPSVLAVLTFAVVLREERHLSDAFGQRYDEYRRRVRRWI